MPELSAIPHVVYRGPGYDGQFYAQLAIDPLLRTDAIRTALDSPHYRGRRILTPWIAHLFAAGNPARAVYFFAWLNVLSWLLLAWLLLAWFPPGSLRNVAAWYGCLFSHGLLASVAAAVPDGPSALLIACAVRAVERGRQALATVILAAAGLARETAVLGAATLVPPRMTGEEFGRNALRAAVVILPLALWIAYLLTLDLPGSYVGRRNFGPPLWGYVTKIGAMATELADAGWFSFGRVSVLTHVALTTQFAVLLAAPRLESPWWRIGAAHAALMLVLGGAVWAGAPGASTRVLLPMTLAFNVLVLRHRWFWPLWLLGNANLLHGLQTIGATEVVPVLGLLESFI